MKQHIVSLSKKLIRISSTRDNPAAQRQVIAIAKNVLAGMSYTEYEHNGVSSILFYNTPAIPKKFTVILNAHLDVVPGTNGQYHPYIQGDRLYGRGAYDMKAAAAVEILLYKELARNLSYPIGLQLVTDEEIGGFDGAKYQKEKGITADCMLVGETSSNFSIGIRSKGIIWMNITFTGLSAHAAYLWNGTNALQDVNTFLSRLWKRYPIPMKEVWKTTINVSSVTTGNTTNNKVPDMATVRLDIRYIPGDDQSVIKSIKSMLPKNATVEIPIYEPSRASDANDIHVKQLLTVAKHILCKNIPLTGKCGGTDLRHYPQTVGMEFGPIGKGPHEDNEWVSIKSLSTLYDVLRLWLLDEKWEQT